MNIQTYSLIVVTEDDMAVTHHLTYNEALESLIQEFGDEDDTIESIEDSMAFNHPYVMYNIGFHIIDQNGRDAG